MPEDNPADYLLESALLEGNTDTPRPQVMIGAAASKNLMVLLILMVLMNHSDPAGALPRRPQLPKNLICTMYGNLPRRAP